MAKIEARGVRGAKDHRDIPYKDATEELEDEGYRVYSDLDHLLAAEQRGNRRAAGYGKVKRREVSDEIVVQAVRNSAGQ